MTSIELSAVSAGANGSVFGSAWQGPSKGVYQYDPVDALWIARNELPPNAGITLTSISGGSGQHVWAVGQNDQGTQYRLYRWEPSEDGWLEVLRPVGNDHLGEPIVGADGTVWLYTMRSGGPSDKALWRYKGGAWTRIANADPASLQQVSIADANSIWSVRNDPLAKVYKYDATLGWQPQPGPTPDSGYSLHLISIGAASDGTLVVTGKLYNSIWQATYACWRRAAGSTTWVKMPQPASNLIQSVSAGGADNIWGVGYQGNFAVYRWDSVKQKWHGVITSDVPAAKAIAKVQTNLLHMIELNDTYHDYFQDNIAELYNLMQVNSTDPGQVVVTTMIRLSFKAVSAAPFPGAGAVSGVLGGVFDWMVADHSGDLNKTFADVWARFSKNSIYLRTTLSNIHDDVPEYWAVAYTNPESGEITKIADLIRECDAGQGRRQAVQRYAPDDLKSGNTACGSRCSRPSGTMSRSSTRRSSGSRRGQRWTPGFSATSTTTKTTNITVNEQAGKYYLTSYWLGYGLFPLGHHEAPSSLCEALFTDDGVGNIVRPDSIATRSDVFNNWQLQVQKVSMPPTATDSRAAAVAAGSSGDATPAGISADDPAGMPRPMRRSV